eukprot:791030_1
MATPIMFFEEIGFVSGWIGVICCLLAFTLLMFKSADQIRKLKAQSTDQHRLVDRLDTVILLSYAFACTFFTAIYCLYYGTVGSDPHKLHLIMTPRICKYTTQYMAFMGWACSHYCFYCFMLWRIKASFREPISLKLSKCTLRICFILIHLCLVFNIFYVLWTPYVLLPIQRCGIGNKRNIFNGFTTADMREIAWWMDFGLTATLFFLFAKRLCKLSMQNHQVNAFKRRTIVLGILGTVTSLVFGIVVVSLPSEKLVFRYFVPLDLIVNLLCVVFTFGYHDISCRCAQEEEDYTYEFEHPSEKTISTQPTDSVVWDILIGEKQWV